MKLNIFSPNLKRGPYVKHLIIYIILTYCHGFPGIVRTTISSSPQPPPRPPPSPTGNTEIK